VSQPRIPHSAKEIAAALADMGFKFNRFAGSGHIVFTREGVKGQVVTSCSPRSQEHACKRARADARRLMESQGVCN
jgi:predicted RNA binding protein YcfA (HicA-like mRNA interferase family)